MSEELAKYINDKLFELGDDPNDKCHRIGFMGGTYPDKETNLGGMSKEPMLKFFVEILNSRGFEKMNDPTYIKEQIEANPVWNLAFVLSEIENDNAPIGWGKYIYRAELLMQHFDIKVK